MNGNYFVQLTVQICRNGVYTPVCSDGWDVADAIVVCRDQGYYPPEFGVLVVMYTHKYRKLENCHSKIFHVINFQVENFSDAPYVLCCIIFGCT